MWQWCLPTPVEVAVSVRPLGLESLAKYIYCSLASEKALFFGPMEITKLTVHDLSLPWCCCHEDLEALFYQQRVKVVTLRTNITIPASAINGSWILELVQMQKIKNYLSLNYVCKKEIPCAQRAEYNVKKGSHYTLILGSSCTPLAWDALATWMEINNSVMLQ